MGASSSRLVPQIIHGDALTKLKELESETIDCCITSPPYWALRDYKTDGQLGLEPTFQEYVTKLVNVFDEIKRVLKKSGTCWVVIGDTYSRTSTSQVNNSINQRNGYPFKRCGINQPTDIVQPSATTMGIPSKSLCLIPERFAISMVDHGWVLRNKIIWYKPNCMPSSAKDRFTVDWEYVYFFTKSQKYFFETQYEPLESSMDSRHIKKDGLAYSPGRGKYSNAGLYSGNDWSFNTHLGRIKRCVWKISTKPFSGAHFAVFPPDLIVPMIKAGCPEYICKKCGTPRKLEYEETRVNTRPGLDVGNMKSGTELDPNQTLHISDLSKYRQQIIRQPKFGGNHASEYGPRTYSGKEWNPSIKQQDGMTNCGCQAGWDSGVCLDPFFGAGTVGLVALQNGRDFVGIELNPEYIKIANTRLDPLLNQQKLR